MSKTTTLNGEVDLKPFLGANLGDVTMFHVELGGRLPSSITEEDYDHLVRVFHPAEEDTGHQMLSIVRVGDYIKQIKEIAESSLCDLITLRNNVSELYTPFIDARLMGKA